MSVTVEGEVDLPTNPNCVQFSADAVQLLVGREWIQVQQMARHALEIFHGASGIDCAVWFGRRVGIDRKNRPHSQITMNFVFDGPASREHMASLERGVAEASVLWGSGSVVPVPHHAFPSLMAKSGKIYQVWLEVEGEPRTLWMEARDGQIHVDQANQDSAKPEQFHRYVRHVLGVIPPLHEREVHLEKLKLAFARRFSEKIIEADGIIAASEEEFMRQMFPVDLLQRFGLAEPEAFEALYGEACEQLPHLLGHHEKLALVGLFFAACHSDGQLAASEMKVLREAAVVLGLEGPEVVEYLARLW